MPQLYRSVKSATPKLFAPKTSIQDDEAFNLVVWWLTFINDIQPADNNPETKLRIVDKIYNTCESLLSLQQMELIGMENGVKYDFTADYIGILDLLKQDFDRRGITASSIKTPDDVLDKRIFQVCIDVLNERTQFVTLSGLYNDMNINQNTAQVLNVF